MKKLISLLLSLLIVSACLVAASAAFQPRTVYESKIIPTDSVRMTAHRGYSAVAPENTLPAFRLAGEYGFWGAECDTSPTSDGVWVIMHDSTVDRMTDGEGDVSSLTYAQISALTVDAGSNVEEYPGLKVPTLTEYLDVCKEYGLHPVIEIKGSAKVSDMESLATLLLAREEKDMLTIITFERALAARIKELMPDTPVYILIGGDQEQAFIDTVGFAVENDLDGIDFAAVWEKKMVRKAQRAGLKTMVWTVDDIGTVEKYYRMGVRDVTTNSLTQTAPDVNAFQKLLRNIRDFFYSVFVRLKNVFGI